MFYTEEGLCTISASRDQVFNVIANTNFTKRNKACTRRDLTDTAKQLFMTSTTV